MGLSEDELSRMYQALSNPHRRRIIELLGKRGPLSFSELRRSLNISIGALYHNLEQLGPLVFQLSDRRYALTDKGVAVYNLMRREADLLEDSGPAPRAPRWAEGLFGFVCRLFFPKDLLSSLYARLGPKMAAASASALALGALVCALTRTEVILTYVRASRGVLSVPWLGLRLAIDPSVLSALTFISTWLALSIPSYVVVSAVKWSWDWAGMAKFMEGSALSTLPATAYVLIHNAATGAGATGYAAYASLGAAFALLWAMMIGSMAASLSIAKRISSVRALAVMVAVAYLCLASQQLLVLRWILQH